MNDHSYQSKRTATDHKPSDDVPASKALRNLHLILLGRTYILGSDDTGELLARREGYPIDDGDGEQGLQRRQSSDRA